MTFRAGEYDRDRVSKPLQPFCPISAFHSIQEIPLEGLKLRGKKLILLDVDNTIVRWHSEDFTEEVLEWLSKAQAMGFELCILSNTKYPQRLARISERLKIATIRDRFKPSTKMYLLALAKYHVQPEETIMVGDQIMTDILGANRSGIEAIWVHRIHDHEFFGTKLNRMIERVIVSRLSNALKVVEHMPEAEAGDLTSQFGKFIVVGGSSFVIDAVISYFILYHMNVGGHPVSETIGSWIRLQVPGRFASDTKAAVPIAKTVSGLIAILNSFYWNRKWTFGITSADNAKQQFIRFFVLSLSGLVINALIVSLLTSVLPFTEKRSFQAATVVAAGIVAFWNFGGQRLWAFKKR
jgi:uncharacterized protein